MNFIYKCSFFLIQYLDFVFFPPLIDVLDCQALLPLQRPQFPFAVTSLVYRVSADERVSGEPQKLPPRPSRFTGLL